MENLGAYLLGIISTLFGWIAEHPVQSIAVVTIEVLIFIAGMYYMHRGRNGEGK